MQIAILDTKQFMAISEVFNEDCIEGMKRFPDGFFDIAVVDPPYGIGADKGKWGSNNIAKVTDYGKRDWDKNYPEQQYFDELFRVSKNQIIWGANHFISRIPIDSSCWIIWDKDNTGNYADCEIAWTSFESAVRIFRYRWNGMLQQNMKNKEVRIHPTQKPVALYRWLYEKYNITGGMVILDTHLGSGSSRCAAHDLDFDFYGWEIDKKYFDDGNKRFAIHTQQQKLF